MNINRRLIFLFGSFHVHTSSNVPNLRYMKPVNDFANPISFLDKVKYQMFAFMGNKYVEKISFDSKKCGNKFGVFLDSFQC